MNQFVTLSDLTLLWALLGLFPSAYKGIEDLDNTELAWNHRAETRTQAPFKWLGKLFLLRNEK